MLFIGGVVTLHRRSCLYFLYSWIVLWSLNFLFPLILCCVCLLFTLWMGCLCQYVTKRVSNRWNVGILFVYGELKLFLKGGENKIFDVSNLGRELVCIFVMLYFVYFLFTCIFHTCIYGFFNISGIYKLIHLKLLSSFATDR